MKLTEDQKFWLLAIRNHGACISTKAPIHRSVIIPLVRHGLIESFRTYSFRAYSFEDGKYKDYRVTLIGFKAADKIEKQQKENGKQYGDKR